jgi:hypothetical protein
VQGLAVEQLILAEIKSCVVANKRGRRNRAGFRLIRSEVPKVDLTSEQV